MDWPPIEDWLEKDPVSAFWHLYRHERDAYLAQRYHAMALLCDVTPVDNVAKVLGVHEDTILNWVDRYNASGIDGLRPPPHLGSPPRLDPSAEARLIEDIKTSPRVLGYDFNRWTCKTIAIHLEKAFGVVLSEGGVQALLVRLDVRQVVPHREPAKADEEKKGFYRPHLRGQG